jgi:peptidoglycan hydrolase-like protein with peptidoglycan-binding domain
MFDEFEANGHGESLADEWSGEAGKSNLYRSGRSSARRPAYPPRRPPRRPQRPGRRSNYLYRRPLGFNASVLAVEPPPGENLQWVQECLNRKQGLELPVDGTAGPETRSAIRSFQRRQGLPVNGLLDAETERALREFCNSPASQPVDAPEQGGDEEIGHAQMGERNISLKWFSKSDDSKDRYLFTLDEAIKAVQPNQGGVYIMVGDAKKPPKENAASACSSCPTPCVLKVGIAEEFRSRFGDYKRPSYRWPNRCSWTNLRVYFAQIGGFYSLDRYVERVLDQLLRKYGNSLPGGRPVKPQRVNSRVVIHNVLPTSSALLAKVREKVAQNRLPLERGTVFREGELAAAPSTGAPGSSHQSAKKCSCKRCTTKACPFCGSSPCRCGSTACGPSCSCPQCTQARAQTNATGRWSRQGNQIQVTGVQP